VEGFGADEGPLVDFGALDGTEDSLVDLEAGLAEAAAGGRADEAAGGRADEASGLATEDVPVSCLEPPPASPVAFTAGFLPVFLTIFVEAPSGESM
jgi:hypothetical protein